MLRYCMHIEFLIFSYILRQWHFSVHVQQTLPCFPNVSIVEAGTREHIKRYPTTYRPRTLQRTSSIPDPPKHVQSHNAASKKQIQRDHHQHSKIPELRIAMRFMIGVVQMACYLCISHALCSSYCWRRPVVWVFTSSSIASPKLCARSAIQKMAWSLHFEQMRWCAVDSWWYRLKNTLNAFKCVMDW